MVEKWKMKEYMRKNTRSGRGPQEWDKVGPMSIEVPIGPYENHVKP
jgi:hypothetical protein